MMNLKAIRLQHSLTQEEVAKVIGKTTAAYGFYESGRNEPDIKTILTLADYYGCSIDYLLGHQTKDIIYTNSLSQDKIDLINEIKIMDEREVNLLKGVILRIKMEQESPWLKNKT